MRSNEQGQQGFEELSAYLDGELPAGEAARVVARLEREEDARRTLSELKRLEELLDAWPVPAAAPDLAGRILERSRRVRVARRFSLRQWLAPLAVAAAALLAVWLGRSEPPKAPPALPTEPPAVQQAADEFAQTHLDFLQDYDVIANFETLEAIDQVESNGSGT